jgi:predicted RNase H-like nuclease
MAKVAAQRLNKQNAAAVPDGCRAGWVAFKVELPSLATSVELVGVPKLLKSRPNDLLCMAIDIPIALLDCSRECDKASRRLLGQPRGTSVFAAPCRAALAATTHAAASQINGEKTGRGISQQAFGIIPKIKQVDDAITSDCQKWAFEVHPEVCFWALNKYRPMTHNKKTKDGIAERIGVLRPMFPEIERHLENRPPRVGADDLLDAAAAAWTALRRNRSEAENVWSPQKDERSLTTTIWY